jgi:hypothetical protein
MCDGNCEGCYKNHSDEQIYFLNEAQLKIYGKYLIPEGKPQPLVVQNPSNEATLEKLIQDLFSRKSMFIPKDANACTISDFSGDTQHKRDVDGEEKMFSIYAVQFYQFK